MIVDHILIENINDKIYKKNKKIFIDTSYLSKDANFLKLARKNKKLKAILIKLTNIGYYLVGFENGISTFVKYSKAEDFLKYLRNNYQTMYNQIYSLQAPNQNYDSHNLLIVFSSFQIYPYLDDSADKRYFLKDFSTLSKYIPPNTYILRIADIGGVAGSFYLNTNFDSTIEKNIYKLIEAIRKSLKIKKLSTLLFGFSKGGTASLFYGIKHSYKCVAIDPIITDKFHIENYADSHFTQGVFPFTKDEIFNDLLTFKKLHSSVYIISATKSQQYKYIKNLLDTYDNKCLSNLIVSNHPDIQEHPDVGPNTINIFIMYINAIFYGVIKKKSIEVKC